MQLVAGGALSIVRPVRVARPLTAATVVVPERVAAGSPVPDLIASVTFDVSVVWLPYWSRIATLIVPSVAPAFAAPGCWV